MAEIHYGATLTDFLTAAVAQFPQRPATYFAGHTLTYSELDAQVAAAAGALREMGVRPGDRVALYSANTDQFVIAVHAIFRVGGVLVTINPRSAGPEVEYFLQDSGAEVLLFGAGLQDARYIARVRQRRCRPAAPAPRRAGG